MAASKVGTLYDLGINDQDYVLRGNTYNKQEAPYFAPRFSTGEQGLGDLDLYKVMSQVDWSGGMFQQERGDPSKTNLTQGLQVNLDTDQLEPAPPLTAGNFLNTPPTFDITNPICWAVYRGKLYIGNGTKVYSYSVAAGGWTAVKTNFAGNVLSMAVIADALWVTQKAPTGGIWSLNNAGTWTQYTAYGFTNIWRFNDYLICTGTAGNGDAGRIWKRSNNSTGAGTVTQLGDVGDIFTDVTSGKLFNHRLYLGKPEGLFVWDGAGISTVLDYSANFNLDNFKAMEEFGGFLWFSIRKVLWRYNGATVERVQKFDRKINVIQAHGDALYVGLAADDLGNTNDCRTYRWNGNGFELAYSLTRLGVWALPRVVAAGNDPTPTMTSSMMIVSGGNSSVTADFNIAELNGGPARSVFSATTHILELSDFDAGFPHIDKYLANVVVDTLSLGTGDSVLVEFRTFNGIAWSSYQTLGTLTSASTSGKLPIYKAGTTPQANATFRRVQVKLTATYATTTVAGTGVYPQIKAVAVGYYVRPELKWQWSMNILTQGSEDTPLLVLDNETEEELTPKQLREKLYLAARSAAPVSFLDIDWTQLNGGINASVQTITVDSTDTFDPTGFIKIGDEIIEYTGKTATTFTGCTRGALNTTGATHADDLYVNKYYRVVVTKLPGERVQTTSQETTGTETDFQLVLQQA